MRYFKSQINFDSFYLFGLIYVIVSIFIFAPSNHILWLKYLWGITSPITIYFALSLLACRYDFYEDKVILNFVFSYKKKYKTVFYKDIKRVRYTIDGRYLFVYIILDLTNKRSIAHHLNSFSDRSYQRRKEILKFLQSKGVQIEVSRDFNDRKELNILS